MITRKHFELLKVQILATHDLDQTGYTPVWDVSSVEEEAAKGLQIITFFGGTDSLDDGIENLIDIGTSFSRDEEHLVFLKVKLLLELSHCGGDIGCLHLDLVNDGNDL